jgi:hypothetical protein
MIEFLELGIGWFWMAAYTAGVWTIGLLMGLGLAKLAALAGRRRTDVDDVLAKQRARARAAAAQASVPPVDGMQNSGGVR